MLNFMVGFDVFGKELFITIEPLPLIKEDETELLVLMLMCINNEQKKNYS